MRQSLPLIFKWRSVRENWADNGGDGEYGIIMAHLAGGVQTAAAVALTTDGDAVAQTWKPLLKEPWSLDPDMTGKPAGPAFFWKHTLIRVRQDFRGCVTCGQT